MNKESSNFFNYMVGFIFMFCMAALSYKQWETSQAFGHAFSCGIAFTAGALFLKGWIKMVFFQMV